MLNAAQLAALRFDAPRSPVRLGMALLLCLAGGLKGWALLQVQYDPGGMLRPQEQAVVAEFELLLGAWLLWGGYAGYDRWFGQELNNAHLASVATYTQLLPAFRGLIRKHGGDMAAFYKEATEIGSLSAAERAKRLAALAQ